MPDHVEVLGTGSASAVPDVVVLDARVQCEAPDVAGALGAATGRVTTALQAVADHGVTPVDRRTTEGPSRVRLGPSVLARSVPRAGSVAGAVSRG